MGLKIGVIAEDKSDVEVLYELTCKLTSETNFSFRKFIGHGCGKLRKKCGAWSENLLKRGCSHLIVIHDLDNNDESRLRRELETIITNVGFRSHVILIPVYEIEAWLLFDPKALKKTFSMQREPKLNANPETIRDPKLYLSNIVWKSCKKRYLNTVHNQKIANAIRIDKLRNSCSFSPYPDFIANNVNN